MQKLVFFWEKRKSLMLKTVKSINCFNRSAKIIVTAFVLMALFAALLGVQASAYTEGYVVYLDDEEIGIATDGEEILNYVAMLSLREAKHYGMEALPVQEVRVEMERRKGELPDDTNVKETLRDNLQFDIYGYMITVNDRPTVAVRSMPDFDKVMTDIKSAYVSERENAVIQDIVLNEKIEARWEPVDNNQVYSAESAAEILKRGTDKREVYLVSRGDTIWGIARANHMTEEEIRAANPRLQDNDRLQVGEELELIVADPLVHVSVTEDVTVIENIAFKTTYQNDNKMYTGTTRTVTGGRHGKLEVTYRITKENGREIEREKLSETVLEEPRTQVIARGTLKAPVRGSGQFLWPVSGGGRVTSPYGPRGRSFHYGVDIGAPTGTPIVASDAGVVIYSGWAGSYGILVTIDHGNGFITKYAHASATLVSVGQKVQKGAQIARVGSTGNSTGPHLHFEILRNGTHVNPLNYW